MEQNYQFFLQELQNKIESTIASGGSKHLFSIEISNLQFIESIYGSKKSDQIMKSVVEKLNKDLHFDDIYHVGDGVLSFCSEHEMDEFRVSNFTANLKRSIQFFNYCDDEKKEPFHLKFRMGIVQFPKFGDDAEELLKKSFSAMVNVRTDIGLYYNSYNDFLTQQKVIKYEMQRAITFKNAITENRLRLAYQPLIDGQTGKINHYECLLRIVDDAGKIISAGPYIEIAEDLDFIDVIDEMVLEMVVEEVKKCKDIKFAFNLSSLGVYNDQWLEKAKNLMQDPEVASRIIVEITETAIHKDIGKVAYFIAILQEIGCQVALDDFGTGHTSFRQLKSLPVDIIKIDGSFIKGIATKSEDELFIKVLLSSIHSLGFKSVAEFVENGEVAKILMDLGVDYMQGHYFSEAKNHRIWEHK